MQYDFKNKEEMEPESVAFVNLLEDKFRFCEEVFFGTSDKDTARRFVAEKIHKIYGHLPVAELKKTAIDSDCLDGEIRRWVFKNWLIKKRGQVDMLMPYPQLLERHWIVYKIFIDTKNKTEIIEVLARDYRRSTCGDGDVDCLDKRFRGLLIWTMVTVHLFNLALPAGVLAVGYALFLLMK